MDFLKSTTYGFDSLVACLRLLFGMAENISYLSFLLQILKYNSLSCAPECDACEDWYLSQKC